VVDKVHYQAAAAEVADGNIDQALWIKVNADMPEAAGVAKQAKYIQLRAEEIARSTAKAVVANGVSRIKIRMRKIVGWLAVAGLALFLLVFVTFEYNALSDDYAYIKLQAFIFKSAADALPSALRDRNEAYVAVQNLGTGFQYPDGTTAGDEWAWAKQRASTIGGQAITAGGDIRDRCRFLNEARNSFPGSMMDPMVRDPTVTPICSLWLSDRSPDRGVSW